MKSHEDRRAVLDGLLRWTVQRISHLLIDLALLFSVFAGGCSVIGYSIGQSHDRSWARTVSILSVECAPVETGSKMIVRLFDGETLRGTYQGLVRQSPAEYRHVYNAFRTLIDPSQIVPAPGDSVRVITRSGEQTSAVFVAFDHICYRSTTRPVTRRRVAQAFLYLPASSDTVGVDLARIERVQFHDGTAVEGVTLEEMDSTMHLPDLSAIRLQTATALLTIPLSRIHSIDVPIAGNARWIGLGIGLVVDLALLTVVALAIAFSATYTGY
jgi:hypothetical protein